MSDNAQMRESAQEGKFEDVDVPFPNGKEG